MKLFADGSISGRTAAVRNPYVLPEGAPEPEFPSGMMTLTEPVFRAAMAFARKNSVQCAIHIMGDRSIDAVLDWLSTESPWLSDVPSVRLEHVSMMRPDQLEKMLALPIRPALTTQIIFPFAEWRSYHAALTQKDFSVCYAVKTLSEKVEAMALSSDAPCTTWSDTDDIFVSLVSIGTALSLYTSRAALVMPERGIVGTIEPGARANFITLSANPFMIAPSKLRDLRVTGVWKDGKRLLG